MGVALATLGIFSARRAPLWPLDLPPLDEGPENDYRLFVAKAMRLMLNKLADQTTVACDRTANLPLANEF